MSDPVNVCAMVKGAERYIVLFDDEHRTDACRQLGAWASHPDLESFNWLDCAQMSAAIRHMVNHEVQESEWQRPRRPR